jgi:hypothetical protein
LCSGETRLSHVRGLASGELSCDCVERVLTPSGKLWLLARCCRRRVAVLDECWPRASHVRYAKRPKVQTVGSANEGNRSLIVSFWCKKTWKADCFPNEDPTAPRPWGYKRTRPGRYGAKLCNMLRQTQGLTTYFETPIMPSFVQRVI